MAYTKVTIAPAATVAIVERALKEHGIEQAIIDTTASRLASQGVTVKLEPGPRVWVSCVVHDRPETPLVDFLTVAIGIRNGAPWEKPNGQLVARVFWHGVWQELLASQGKATVRKALMLSALGEPQPKTAAGEDVIPTPDPSTRSIRAVALAATEIEAADADVL